MRKILLLTAIFVVVFACNQPVEKTRGIPAEEKVKTEAPVTPENFEQQREELKKQGYEVFTYEESDTSYLMQQYYIAFLKEGENRDQDSTEIAQLQEQHLAFLGKMVEEGYASLVGPMGDGGEIRGIAVYNTPTQRIADSLANLDPMVKAGRLQVEVRPWWTAKGGKLD